MSAKVIQGHIVLRRWSRTSGLTEKPVTFSSLEELYTFCLSVADPDLVDRVVINGQDENGAPRVLTFVFQSITVSSKQ
jgi:hypothetical protein